METDKVTEKPKKKAGCLIWSIPVGVVIAIIAMVAPETPKPIGPGDTVMLAKGGAWFAVNDQAWSELTDAGDSVPLLTRLVTQRKIFHEADGASVLIVRASIGSFFCQVVSGENVGKEGWVDRNRLILQRVDK